MITRIKIQGYKSFQDIEIRLQPITVIFGPNAAGKSNLLDAIYLISRLATSKSTKVAFEGHRGLPLESFYYGDEGYEQLLNNRSAKALFEIDVRISDKIIETVKNIIQGKRKSLENGTPAKKLSINPYLRYKITLEILPETGYLRILDESLIPLKANGQSKKSPKPFISTIKEGNKQKIHLRMEGQARPTDYEVGLDHTIVSTALYEPHYPHITAFLMEMAQWRVYYLEPKVLMREDTPISEIEAIGPRGENLASFLNTLKIRYKKNYENFILSLKSILPTVEGIEVERIKEGLLNLKIIENNIPYSAKLVSEGTLRILGLLAIVHPMTPTEVIGYEEPENGVHPARLKLIADILKNTAESYDKQIIVNSHSPVFPEYFDNESLFVCRKDGSLTKIEQFDSKGPLFGRKEIERGLEERILRGDYG